jgi:putative ABC transport system permease protein
LQGIGIGVLVSVLFSVVPLLDVRHVRPSLLLRHETPQGRRDWLKIATALLVSAALVGLAVWQAASVKIGLWVLFGFAGLTLVLHLTGLGLIRLIAPLTRSPSFTLRHAVLRLSRPGNQTRVVLLAVGLGSFFVIGVRSLQANLLHEFALEISEDAPDMFLIDVQRDQAPKVGEFVAAWMLRAPRLIPVLRARITGVKGRETNLDNFEDVRGKGSLAREYTITYRATLDPNERVTKGMFWTGPSAAPEVSIEKSIHERFSIDVGDTIRFDILGRIINARVGNIREVNWKDSRNGGFMFVFRPGTLESAPQTYVSPLKGPDDPATRARLQRDLVERFPNVSVIDLREILDNIRGVVANVTLAITVVGALVLFSGGLILIGAVAMTKFQRVYEAAIFKTLGASTRTIGGLLLLEYGVLGALAGTIGSLGAIALTWGVSRYALDIPWHTPVAQNIGGIVVTTVMVALIGVGSSLDVLRRKPLATLRAE